MKVSFFLLFLFFTCSLFGQSDPAQWQADISFLQTELIKRHPNLFAYYPKKNFEADLHTLSTQLDGKTDLQIALELQTILARLRDAQTRFDLAPLLQMDKVIPIGFGWYAEGLCVSATVKRFAPALGKRVLEINGLNAEAALAKMSPFFAVENQEALRKEAPQWLRFPAAFRMAGLSTTDTLSLLLVDEKGQRYFIQTHPIDFQKDRSGLQPAQYVPKAPDLRWNPLKQLFSIVWLEPDSIAYVQYNACYSQEMSAARGDSTGASQLPPFQPVVDSVLSLLNQHPGARFFYDLRFNIGGDPVDGIALAKRLAALPGVNLPNRLYVAVNRYSAMAAVEVAAAFDVLTNATLTGEPPAQRPNHFGDPKFFYLPNSKLQVFYGSRRVDAIPGNPDALHIDMPIELPFPAFRDGRDPVLDYVRGLPAH